MTLVDSVKLLSISDVVMLQCEVSANNPDLELDEPSEVNVAEV